MLDRSFLNMTCNRLQPEAPQTVFGPAEHHFSHFTRRMICIYAILYLNISVHGIIILYCAVCRYFCIATGLQVSQGLRKTSLYVISAAVIEACSQSGPAIN